MNDTVRMIIAALSASALFLLLFLLLNWNLMVCILLCVGVYFGLFFLLKPSRKIAGMDVESLPGGEEMQKLLEDARADLLRIEHAVRAIAASDVRRDGEELYAAGMRILDYLKENPDKIKLARRFFTYYLDTTAKILERYVEFQNTGLHSEEVEHILTKTAETLPVLNRAFEGQFTHLMQGELMDVEADLELLKSTLKMEDGT
ncbi:MAG TPA: 5-bromo-4-chloroindolyl phosphate hydrolysis family protein [Candidatus Fimimorpha excrementavium]|nr:5-bromo-4-chloroindolyl phosphate hydrolysis family protein [Candidatus Fimimorpha excrementavium]